MEEVTKGCRLSEGSTLLVGCVERRPKAVDGDDREGAWEIMIEYVTTD